ncbi:MAG: hypothetical protein JKY25_03100 [Robiginitomaculum sp.]|nr:hypothetical protein [Robiginitomaculum sp.]
MLRELNENEMMMVSGGTDIDEIIVVGQRSPRIDRNMLRNSLSGGIGRLVGGINLDFISQGFNPFGGGGASAQTQETIDRLEARIVALENPPEDQVVDDPVTNSDAIINAIACGISRGLSRDACDNRTPGEQRR